MPEQTVHPSSLEQLKVRVQHLKTDASDALHAARHDYTEALNALRQLRARSHVKAFVQSHLHINGAKPTRKKAPTPARG